MTAVLTLTRVFAVVLLCGLITQDLITPKGTAMDVMDKL